MIKKTYRFTLIEIIIATSLFAILIFSTTSLFFQYQKLSARIDTIRPKVFERTIFYEKMCEMTATMDSSSIKKTSPEYTEFLSFNFDNGFKDNADFSGRCLCKLYRTNEKKLIYKISNTEGKEIKRSILENITSFSSRIDKNILYLDIQDINHYNFSYAFELFKAPSKRSS